MKKLAIIGANESIAMLINKAKALGYETHVFAWKTGDTGESLSDYFYPISIDKKEQILQKCKEIGITGVCSITSDYAFPTVNYIGRNMGFLCNPERTEELARNKYKMRCAFRDAGIYTPPFIKLDAHYHESEVADIVYPVIVKPIDRWSSKGVTRIDSPEHLRKAVSNAAELSLDGNAIVEGFMEGTEYSAECICYRGNSQILAFTEKNTTGFPHYIETGHIQPANISDEIQNRAENVIKIALKALDIQNGAAHVEFRVLNNGHIGIIEIGARMGGDYIGTDLTPASTGLDYIKMVIDVAIGKEPDFTYAHKYSKVSVKFIIERNDYEEYLRRKNELRILRATIWNTNFECPVVDSNTRHGYYIYVED